MSRWLAPVAALAVLAGCTVETALPEQLAGSYTTSDDRYAECYLELSPTRFAYRTTEGSVEQHRITKVRRETAGGGTQYTVVYLSDDGREDELVLRPLSDAGALTLGHRPGVTWSRVASTPLATGPGRSGE